MGLGLITLFFLVAFSLLYLDRALAEKPDFVGKAAHKVQDNIQLLSFWGLIYSLIALVLTPVLLNDGFDVTVSLLANVLLFLLILPLSLDHFLERYPGKVPESVIVELKNIVGAVSRREKAAGYAGAALSFLLFLALFS